MATSAKTELRAESIKAQIGSRILNDKADLLSGDLGEEMRELLELRGVLVFPKISFSEEEQIAFTKTLGKYAPERVGDEEKVTKITIDPEVGGRTASYLRGSLF